MRIPEHFEFLNKTKFVSGNGALANIPSELADYGAYRPLLVSAPENKARAENVISEMSDSGLTIGAFYDNAGSPAEISKVIDIAGLLKSRRCDSILCVGGESTMHLCKSANLLAHDESRTLADYQSDPLLIRKRLLPLFFIASAENDGDEATYNARIKDYSINSKFLSPDEIIIDPITAAADDSQKALSSALFAFAAAADLLCRSDSHPLTASYCKAAISFSREHAVKSAKGNPTAGLASANAAAYTGIVRSNMPESAAAALGIAIEESTGIRRGFGAALVLSAILDFHESRNSGTSGDLLSAVDGLDRYASSSNPSSDAIIAVRSFLGGIKQLPSSLHNAGLAKVKISRIAAAASRLSTDLNESQLFEILEKSHK